jgi:hypothetical protein
MKNILLEVYKNGPYIKAPDYCPYKFYENESLNIVHSSLCPLCNLCKFDPFIKKLDELDLKTSEFINYLTLLNTEVSTMINNQNYFLQSKGRLPLVILINPEVFDSMLKLSYRDDFDMYNSVHSYFLNTGSPICFILGCPVHFSRKLTQSKVMVVGEFKWE